MTSSQWLEEAVECPGPTRFLDALENIFYSSRKISDDLFLLVHQNFSNSPPNFFKLFIQIFHFFASVVKFHENSLLGWPPVLHHAPATTFFSSSVDIYLHFFIYLLLTYFKYLLIFTYIGLQMPSVAFMSIRRCLHINP